MRARTFFTVGCAWSVSAVVACHGSTADIARGEEEARAPSALSVGPVTVVAYSDLDNGHMGTSVALSNGTAVYGVPELSFNAPNAGAYGVDGYMEIGQQSGGELGFAVAASPTLIVAGQPGQGPGFIRWAYGPTESWIQGPGASGGRFGAAVGVSGSDVVVGAPYDGKGTARIYHVASDGTVTPPTSLVPSALANNALFGYAVAIDNDVAAVGAPADGTGSIRIFERQNGVWNQVFSYSDSTTQSLGNAIAVDGDTVVAGAWRTTIQGANEAGAAAVFSRGPNGWEVQPKLVATSPHALDHFGRSVAARNGHIVVGANLDDEQAVDAGAVYGFSRSSGVWVQTMKLTAFDGQASDYFGSAVALEGNTLIVGAWGIDSQSPDGGGYYLTTLQNSQGEVCGANADCGSGFCVDGVCCDSACGGGGGECQACSAILGASADGTCTIKPDGSVCSTGICTQGSCGMAMTTASSSSSTSSSSTSSTSSSTSATTSSSTTGSSTSSTSTTSSATSSSSSSSSGNGGSGGAGTGGAGGAGGAVSGTTSASTGNGNSTSGGPTTTVTSGGDMPAGPTTGIGAGGSSNSAADSTTGCAVSPLGNQTGGSALAITLAGLALVLRKRSKQSLSARL